MCIPAKDGRAKEIEKSDRYQNWRVPDNHARLRSPGFSLRGAQAG